ncbi:MAG: MgtC/SapB family protein [Acidimicrobiia bacterium]|nr:MgtC/SapB family protein [Acidimicrobiia bacterium]
MEDVLRIGLALLIGGLLGLEREYRDKTAGFRTISLITVGAALFTMYSLRLGAESEDPVRIAAGIVSGVGFLGAGVILRHQGRIVGITTAATIWLAAALGMGIGSGNYFTTIVAAGAVLTVLWVFPVLEFRIDRARESNTYKIVAEMGASTRIELKSLLQEHDLDLFDEKVGKATNQQVLEWRVSGSHNSHEAFAASMLKVPAVLEFEY